MASINNDETIDKFKFVSSSSSNESINETKNLLRRRLIDKNTEKNEKEVGNVEIEEELDHKLFESEAFDHQSVDVFPINHANVVIIIVAVFFRLLVALHSYSGAGVAPIFGDFEAQRHWMEITINVPLKDWYRNTGANDLKYWGLDYPPLSAYWAYLTGYM